MSGPLLTKSKLAAAAASTLKPLEDELPEAKNALAQMQPEPVTVTSRAKQLYRILVASASERAYLVASFFKDLVPNVKVALLAAKLSYRAFGFKSLEEMCEYLKNRLTAISAEDRTLEQFANGMRGRKWWFIGTILFERFIKFGPVRQFLDETARDALGVLNERIQPGKAVRMVRADGSGMLVRERFGPAAAGLEFHTPDGRQSLDFGHIAFNKDGQWLLPTPTEIKLPSASKGVARQFADFMRRMLENKVVLVTIDAQDFKQLGPGAQGLKAAPLEGGLVQLELPTDKLVFDPLARNQMVVRPGRRAWGEVKDLEKGPDVDIGVSATTKYESFNFWTLDVDVSRTPFETLYKAVFGIKD